MVTMRRMILTNYYSSGDNDDDNDANYNNYNESYDDNDTR